MYIPAGWKFEQQDSTSKKVCSTFKSYNKYCFINLGWFIYKIVWYVNVNFQYKLGFHHLLQRSIKEQVRQECPSNQQPSKIYCNSANPITYYPRQKICLRPCKQDQRINCILCQIQQCMIKRFVLNFCQS